MRIISFVLGLFVLMASAQASISLQMDFYNSEDSMSMSLDGYNLEFESFCELESNSLIYNNGGSSQRPDTDYSYALTLNGETKTDSAKTDSGDLAFHGTIEAGGETDVLEVSHKAKVIDYDNDSSHNATLSASYGSSQIYIEENIELSNATYVHMASLTRGSEVSQGSGNTIVDVPGLREAVAEKRNAGVDAGSAQEEAQSSPDTENSEPSREEAWSDQGVRYSLRVTDRTTGKQGSIDADIMGRTETLWITGMKSDEDSSHFGFKSLGADFSPMSDLVLKGQTSDFPEISLPPKTRLTGKYNESDTDSDSQRDLPEMAENEFKDFDAQFPGWASSGVWYYLRNLFEIEGQRKVNPPSINASSPLDTYKLGMQFVVKGE